MSIIGQHRQAHAHLELKTRPCGLDYKPMTIVNDDSMVVNKLETLLTDDTRVVIYDRHMFIVQRPGFCLLAFVCPCSRVLNIEIVRQSTCLESAVLQPICWHLTFTFLKYNISYHIGSPSQNKFLAPKIELKNDFSSFFKSFSSFV